MTISGKKFVINKVVIQCLPSVSAIVEKKFLFLGLHLRCEQLLLDEDHSLLLSEANENSSNSAGFSPALEPRMKTQRFHFGRGDQAVYLNGFVWTTYS